MKLIILFNILFAVIFLQSCVGTVEEFGEPTQKSVINNPYEIRFDGIIEAKATAHNKVRVYFKPAQGGSGEFTYNAYINGNYSSAQASTSRTEVDSEGNIYIDVGGLDTGSTNAFLVRAYDVNNAVEDKNNIIINATSLPFEVPNFDGIYTLENVAGLAGETSLKATWIKATAASEGSGFGDNPRAVSGYNIYVGEDKDNLTLFGSVSDPEITSYILTGLKTNTHYYVRVLARDSQTPVNLEDANLEIKSLSTKSAQPISFLGVKSATIPNSTQGFSKINLSWESGTGAYDRYRIFVKTNAANPDPEVETAHSADITDLTTTNIQITVTNPYTLYYVTVVACNSSVCDEYEGEKVNLPVTTTPPVAPFNGIINLEQASGQFGLTQLEASWISPDTTQGVYDQIKLFEMDNLGNLVGEIPLCTSSNDPCYEIVSPTKRKIINLTQGTEYCFMAKAYSTTPYKADEPNGRTHLNEITRCATPTFKEPGFVGPHNTCDNITSTSLSVNWDQPSPTGTYEKFEIYYTAINTPFDFTQAIAGNTDYTKITLAPDSTSWNLTNLNPATSYQIGVKTYLEDLDNPGTGFRDTNVKVINCQTQSATVTHNGWFNINSFGPKVDGRDENIVAERFRDIDTTANPPIYIPYPQEHKFGNIAGTWPDPDAASNSGMVVIQWDDFEVDGVGKIYDLIERHPDNGYNIYRKEYDTSHETFKPVISDVSATALSTWTKLNTSPIKPIRRQVQSNVDRLVKYDRDISTFVDYSVDNTHEKNTKIYWYLVVASIAGKNVQWTSIPSDGLLEVIVPPKNMALMHRWIANQTMCDIIRRPFDRSNNYRCEYNGIASTYDPIENEDFYDIGVHVISSRFGLSSNYTKGGCTDISYYNHFFHPEYNTGNIGVLDGISAPGATGDCIGSRGGYVYNEGRLTARTGDVYYDRIKQMSFINRSGGDFDNPIVGTNWYIPAWDWGQNSKGSIPIEPIADKVATLNAHMPKLSTRYPLAQTLCAANKVSHKSTEYELRLLRRKEQQALFQHSPFLDDNQVYDFEWGRLQGSSSIQTECIKRTRRPYITNLDTSRQDYSVNGNDTYTFLGGHDIAQQRILDNTERNQEPYIASGSSGVNSTEMCVSKFGIQDITGFSTLLSDTFNYNYNHNSLDIKYEHDDLDPSITTERSSNTISFDSGFIDDWKSANGTYYHNYASLGNNSFSPGLTRYSNLYDYSSNVFYNPIMGVYFSCSGTSCIHNSLPDDNQLFSHLTTGTPAIYKGYKLGNRGNQHQRVEYDDTTDREVVLRAGSSPGNGNDWVSVNSLTKTTYWTTANRHRCVIQIPSHGD